jgi:hypothetical protein
MSSKIPETNEIQMYLHCAQCLREKPPNVSPQEWARVQAGWTTQGIQIWCVRHDKNVMHMDFEGAKHPGTMYSVEPTKIKN